MDSTLAAEASVSADKKLVVFIAHVRGRVVHCSITRDTLEQHFWAPIAADDAHLLKVYMDGHKRMVAAVERKVLRGSDEPINLNAADFTH
jgi:hypothetical protein